MTLALITAALRRRPFSLLASALLLAMLASLLGTPAPTALLAWLAASAASLEVWHTLERLILTRLGYRAPTCAERERLDPALDCAHVDILVLDSPHVWVGRGLRCLVVTRAMLDLVEDRALLGLLHEAATSVRRAALAGQVLVAIGTLPMLIACRLAQALTLLGRLLAMAVGTALVLPLIVWPHGFVTWAGRVFGGLFVGLLGSALVSNGFAAPGLALLLAWAIVPGLRALLAWETRRAEAVADRATIAAGLGWELVEALETLHAAGPLQAPTGVHGLLAPPGAPLGDRADRIRRALGAA
jgi:hypothetical protein